MRVVVDTNVLVAGLLSPLGPPGRVVDLILSGELVPCLDDRIMAEYRDVLLRSKFAFAPSQVGAVLAYVESAGAHVMAHPLPLILPDPDDRMFLEVAVAAGAEWLITGNPRHFPAKQRHGVRVVEPRRFVDEYA